MTDSHLFSLEDVSLVILAPFLCFIRFPFAI